MHLYNATERLRFLHDLYRPRVETEFCFGAVAMAGKGYGLKDYICTNSEEKHKDYLKLGEKTVV